ncbi:hypothetical protein [Enhygromyxa salina]|nr:hypothetical protein [Enhygromyxa salina]
MPAAVRRTILFAVTLSLSALSSGEGFSAACGRLHGLAHRGQRIAWAVPPPRLDGSPPAPVEGPRLAPDPESQDDAELPPVPPPSIDPEPTSGIEFAVPPPAASAPELEPTQDPLAARPETIEERRDPDRAPPSGNWLLVSGGSALPLAALAGGYFVWMARTGAAPGSNTKPQVTSIAIATAGISLYGAIALSVGGYRNYQLQRWAQRHRVIALPQGDGLITGGMLALFSAAPLVPVGLSLGSVSSALSVTMVATSITLSAVGGPVMLAIGAKRLSHYRETGGWRRRAPSIVGRPPGQSIPLVPTIVPSIVPSKEGVTLGVAGQF